VEKALESTSRLVQQVRDDPAAEPFVLTSHAYLLAQAGDIDGARDAMARMRTIAERFGQRMVLWSGWGQNVGRTELLAGDPERAERALRPCYEALREIGERAFASTVAGQLAHALVDLDRSDEAAGFALAGRDAAGEVDVHAQILWRSALARIAAVQARATEAVRLADEAVSLAEPTEWPNVKADALLDRARVFDRLGCAGEAAASASLAVGVYRAKGNVAGLAKAEALERGLRS
jgi:hypothetical protein